MTLKELHARITQFVKTYGGNPPKSNQSKSLDLISDFLLVLNMELNLEVLDQEADIVKMEKSKS